MGNLMLMDLNGFSKNILLKRSAFVILLEVVEIVVPSSGLVKTFISSCRMPTNPLNPSTRKWGEKDHWESICSNVNCIFLIDMLRYHLEVSTSMIKVNNLNWYVIIFPDEMPTFTTQCLPLIGAPIVHCKQKQTKINLFVWPMWLFIGNEFDLKNLWNFNLNF